MSGGAGATTPFVTINVTAGGFRCGTVNDV
jgi:hypothetical protein